jgi:hypothetical protein
MFAWQPKRAVAKSTTAKRAAPTDARHSVSRRRRNTCACGGSCPTCQHSRSASTPHSEHHSADRHEQEADRIAAALTLNGGEKAHAPASIVPMARSAAAVPLIVRTSLASPGQPLDTATRAQLETPLGASLDAVRIHTDAAATKSAQALQARAYTAGSHVVFGAGEYAVETDAGRRLLVHELVHTIQQGATGRRDAHYLRRASPAIIQRQAAPGAPQPPPILDPATIRTVQVHLAGQLLRAVPANGLMDAVTEQAISDYSTPRCPAPTRVLDDCCAENMIRELAAADLHDFAIGLCADYHDLLAGRSDVLSIQFDDGGGSFPGVNRNSTVRFEGVLRTILVRAPAFASLNDLSQAISDQLAIPAPAAAPAAPAGQLLGVIERADAFSHNLHVFDDRRSLNAVRLFVGAPAGDVFNAEVLQRIADFQAANGIRKPDGKIDEATLALFIGTEAAPGPGRAAPDSAIRMVIDYYDIDDGGGLVDVHFDEGIPMNQPGRGTQEGVVTAMSAHGASSSRLRIGPAAFKSLATLESTLRHEMLHVRQNVAGITEYAVMEFLGEAIEILEGSYDDSIDGIWELVILDGTRALACWDEMAVLPGNPRLQYWNTFEQVRRALLRGYRRAPTRPPRGERDTKAQLQGKIGCIEDMTTPGRRCQMNSDCHGRPI